MDTVVFNNFVYTLRGSAQEFDDEYGKRKSVGRFITRSKTEAEFGDIVALLIVSHGSKGQSMFDEYFPEGIGVDVVSAVYNPSKLRYHIGSPEECLLEIARDIEAHMKDAYK